MKNKPIYRIYIEGGLHDEFTSRAKAEKVRRQAESEGWNVRVIKYVITVLGEFGVDVR